MSHNLNEELQYKLCFSIYVEIKCIAQKIKLEGLHNCRSQWPRGLGRRSLAARLLDCGFESHPRHGYLSVLSVVCCQVEVSATD